MSQENFEEKYKDVISSLKQLSKVNAKPNFEADLMRKINSYEERPLSFWEKLFSSKWVSSTAGVAFASVLIIFFAVYNNNSFIEEDPFSVIPKMRVNDFSSVEDYNFSDSENVILTDSIIEFENFNTDSNYNTNENISLQNNEEKIQKEEQINKTNFTFKALKPAENQTMEDSTNPAQRMKLKEEE